MSRRTIITLTLLGVVTIIAIIIISGVINTSNTEIVLRNKFNQKITERVSFYDKMWKIISQKGQVAVKNDSSFRANVDIIMTGRKDAQGLFMKWVQETNPNANYEQVSILYQDLSRAIEAQREGFFGEEKVLQDVKFQHDNLLGKFPSGYILRHWMGRKHLEYQPITSDKTDEVFKTGKDNNTKVFE